MQKSTIDSTPIQNLLCQCKTNTNDGWRHLFITTNWDYLFQREIDHLGMKSLPPWLANSHVFHLNGTVELSDSESVIRSPILLESDNANQRRRNLEANKVFNAMIWGRTFVVIGMSFECQVDRALTCALGMVEDDLIVGESTWVLVNPDSEALHSTCNIIKKALPNATIIPVEDCMDSWIKSGMNELKQHDVFK